MFNHEENQLDPRDKHLVTYSKSSKRFIVEASSLQAANISPFYHTYVIGGQKAVIYLWSEKYQLSILYKHNRKVRENGELIADVFVPCFDHIFTLCEHNANAASEGTELHILND